MSYFDEISKAVYRLCNAARMCSGDPGYKPEIAVYVTHDYYAEMLSEISGGVSSDKYEFYSNKTLCGFQVWQVPPLYVGAQGWINHPPYRVVLLNPPGLEQ